MRLRSLRRRLASCGVIALALLASLSVSERGPVARAGAPDFFQGVLNFTINGPTSLAFGPDGRLYVASESSIYALTLDAVTRQVTATEPVATGQTGILGIAFDPTAPPSPVVVYASRQNPAATDGYEGVVSRFTAPAWTRQDIITGLPSSGPFSNHFTNGLAFDSLGRLLIAQGSNTDSGIADGNFWPETPLSAAILIADIDAPGFNGAITYSPAGPPAGDTVNQTGGDVAVYASGTRNPYDLVSHTNGFVYATDNGPPSAAQVSVTCSTSMTGASASDELNRIVAGNYYGHPNRNRGRFDARQCTYRAAEAGSGAGFTGPIAVLPAHCSCDGLAEYTSDASGPDMEGDLLIAQWGLGALARADLSADGLSVLSVTTLKTGLGSPLDVTVGPDGTVYVAEYAGDAITYLVPQSLVVDTDGDGCTDARETQTAPGSERSGGRRDPNDFWDFFDTPNNSNARDRAVSGGDISRIVLRFGANGDAGIDPLSAPPPAGYHTAFDRSPPAPGADPWDVGPADGSISAGDIAADVIQFGHSCAGA